MKSEVSEVKPKKSSGFMGNWKSNKERQVKLKAVQVKHKEKMNTFRTIQRKEKQNNIGRDPNIYKSNILTLKQSGNMVFDFIQISEILPSISVQESWFTLMLSCQIRYSSSMTSSLVLPQLYVSMKPRYYGFFLYLE
ncbi:hypothetical protein K501DRAFT_302064 [Backusella circina FSU 941]|nr:hypothetical protein K501DRAFT_302064 [Backusella circina FSU 941]